MSMRKCVMWQVWLKMTHSHYSIWSPNMLGIMQSGCHFCGRILLKSNSITLNYSIDLINSLDLQGLNTVQLSNLFEPWLTQGLVNADTVQVYFSCWTGSDHTCSKPGFPQPGVCRGIAGDLYCNGNVNLGNILVINVSSKAELTSTWFFYCIFTTWIVCCITSGLCHYGSWYVRNIT